MTTIDPKGYNGNSQVKRDGVTHNFKVFNIPCIKCNDGKIKVKIYRRLNSTSWIHTEYTFKADNCCPSNDVDLTLIDTQGLQLNGDSNGLTATTPWINGIEIRSIINPTSTNPNLYRHPCTNWCPIYQRIVSAVTGGRSLRLPDILFAVAPAVCSR